MTKVIYYIYPYDTCCMSRERIRWMAEICQVSKIKENGQDGNYENVNENKTKAK